jgi:hypothetical protein
VATEDLVGMPWQQTVSLSLAAFNLSAPEFYI